jgi:hypothetical protein
MISHFFSHALRASVNNMQKLTSLAGVIVNSAEANQLLHRPYRPGWTL